MSDLMNRILNALISLGKERGFDEIGAFLGVAPAAVRVACVALDREDLVKLIWCDEKFCFRGVEITEKGKEFAR